MCHNEAEIHAGTNFLSVTLNPVKNRSIILTVSRLWHITEDLKSHCLNADPEKEARGGVGGAKTDSGNTGGNLEGI